MRVKLGYAKFQSSSATAQGKRFQITS